MHTKVRIKMMNPKMAWANAANLSYLNAAQIIARLSMTDQATVSPT